MDGDSVEEPVRVTVGVPDAVPVPVEVGDGVGVAAAEVVLGELVQPGMLRGNKFAALANEECAAGLVELSSPPPRLVHCVPAGSLVDLLCAAEMVVLSSPPTRSVHATAAAARAEALAWEAIAKLPAAAQVVTGSLVSLDLPRSHAQTHKKVEKYDQQS